MARQPRIEYEGACYHVMSRGDRREAIFEDDADREMFLATLGECCERSGWRIYAWVLMSNHYHWVLQTPEGNLVEGMKWFQNTFTRRLNTRHKKWGHVFGGRYKAVVVETEGEERGDYLATLVDYVHLNPVRARMVNLEEGNGLLNYPWSSLARGYGVTESKRAKWMAVREGLELFGYTDRTKDRRQFIERLEGRAREGDESESINLGLRNTLRRGWYWGSQSFRESLLEKIKRLNGNRNYRTSELGRQKEGMEAERWLVLGRDHFAIIGPLIEAAREERVAIAWALHRKTNQSQAWVAEKLGLHTAANVSQQVRRFQKRVAENQADWTKRSVGRRWINHVNQGAIRDLNCGL